ncbi:MAG: amidase [Cyclobacteriaceae bacterium]|nr:amidase [Cyclobacteriaceae bacterium]
MKRRNFLRNSTLGTLAVPALATSCMAPSGSNAGTAEESIGYNEFELLEATIASLQQKMENGDLSARKITEMYLARIEAIDQAGPRLNSVIERNPDALSIADQLDKERAEGKVRGPMHGIPVMIKDNIDTGDQMMTTAGALALEGNKAANDAFIIAKLRESGAVLLGKTNLSEWANFRSTRSSSGWSSRGGQTRNPFVIDRNPCGSSSGSGSAVSANLCAVTIGTETNGSIVCPSSTNGVVGIKPTVGLLSRSGIIPISFSQDTAGPMARTVADAAILLGVLTGVDEKDSKTTASTGNALVDYTPFLDKGALSGARIGVWRSPFGFHEKVDEQLEQSLEVLRAQGAELIDIEEVIPGIKELYGPSRLVLEYEFKDGLNKYLAGANATSGVKSLSDVIAFNKANEKEAMPFFRMEILESSEKRGGLDETEYLEAVTMLQKRSREGITLTMETHRLDAIVGPTGGPAWQIDVVNGDHFGGGSSSPAAWSGFPNITVPAGFVHGLPIGMSFFGLPWSEGRLISLAYAFEQARPVRQAPGFLPTVAF